MCHAGGSSGQRKMEPPFIEGMPKFNGARPGNEDPNAWKPYKIWMGDLWECNGCGAEIIVGVGRHSVSEHYYHNFKAMIEKLNARIQVNDC